MQPRERLTTKEVRVAGLVWEGRTNREIAEQIGTTEQVVKNYLRNTFDKLGVWSRLELALYVASHGAAKWILEFDLRLSSSDGRALGSEPIRPDTVRP
jgi:DNA-binding NarL/FixJ family response regulator